MEQQNPQVVLLPSPGMGHLIPLVELAKLLFHHHHFSVTVIVPSSGPPTDAQKAVLSALPAAISHLFLPPVSFGDSTGGPEFNTEAKIFLTVARSLPSLRETLSSMTATAPVAALVTDPFGMDAFAVAREFGVPPYLFFLSTAMALSFCLYLPKLDEMVSGEYRDMTEPVEIPGCVPVHGRDLMDPVQDRSNKAYEFLLRNVKGFMSTEGVLINTFVELEEGAIKALQAEEGPGKRPPLYPIGPLIKPDSSSTLESERHGCLKWLDGQPHGSVLFVAFGSGGTLSSNQVTELAHGLEMSGQRFLWVVRVPDNGAANGAFFGAESQEDQFLGFLPDGFLDRTKDRGLVVPSWAPQAEVLAHGSTGGFLTHCGWNSSLESIVHGVPLIAWPLYAEQKMNAVMLTAGLKVALRPRIGENGLVGRDEIAQVIKGLMEGEEGKMIGERMKELKDASAKALSKGGSSNKSLSELVTKWKKLAH